jgi:hypothetical protein
MKRWTEIWQGDIRLPQGPFCLHQPTREMYNRMYYLFSFYPGPCRMERREHLGVATRELMFDSREGRLVFVGGRIYHMPGDGTVTIRERGVESIETLPEILLSADPNRYGRFPLHIRLQDEEAARVLSEAPFYSRLGT